MRYIAGFAVIVALFGAGAGLYGQTGSWKTGTLLSFSTHQDTDLYQGTRSPAGITCRLQVDIGDRILFVSHHVGYIWEHLPQLTENGPIRWRMEKGKFE